MRVVEQSIHAGLSRDCFNRGDEAMRPETYGSPFSTTCSNLRVLSSPLFRAKSRTLLGVPKLHEAFATTNMVQHSSIQFTPRQLEFFAGRKQHIIFEGEGDVILERDLAPQVYTSRQQANQ
jgi:hypothetical protein